MPRACSFSRPLAACSRPAAWLVREVPQLRGRPVRRSRSQRGAAFALTSASRRARTRSIGSRLPARGQLLIFGRCSFSRSPVIARVPSPPSPPSPGPARDLVARDHGLPALRNVHLLVNVLHRDVLASAGSLALKRE